MGLSPQGVTWSVATESMNYGSAVSLIVEKEGSLGRARERQRGGGIQFALLARCLNIMAQVLRGRWSNRNVFGGGVA